MGGVISGDIWIKGSGDPFFVSEKALQLAQAIKESGIRQIRGSVFADDSFFEPSSERICLDSDCVGAYNPVVSATAIDFNTLTVKITFPAKGRQGVQRRSGPGGRLCPGERQGRFGEKGGRLPEAPFSWRNRKRPGTIPAFRAGVRRAGAVFESFGSTRLTLPDFLRMRCGQPWSVRA